jgi:hypothetical protein
MNEIISDIVGTYHLLGTYTQRLWAAVDAM